MRAADQQLRGPGQENAFLRQMSQNVPVNSIGTQPEPSRGSAVEEFAVFANPKARLHGPSLLKEDFRDLHVLPTHQCQVGCKGRCIACTAGSLAKAREFLGSPRMGTTARQALCIGAWTSSFAIRDERRAAMCEALTARCARRMVGESGRRLHV